ncbi:unnamed protein product [Linum trigynum]|uniref:Uncharacterized protein n=1 Tax=Linum trigynum TaxID=586398 RepID=A0AAV2E779_9ROSI
MKSLNQKHILRGDEYRLLIAKVVKVDDFHEGIISGGRGWKGRFLPGSPPDWLLTRYQLEQVLLDLLHMPRLGLLPLDVSKGHALLGLHTVKALIIGSHPGLILGLVSRVLLLELEMMVEELLILEAQLLELVSEVVLGWESRTATPVPEGGQAGGVSIIHILRVDILNSLILRSIALVLRGDLRFTKPRDPLDAALDSQQVHTLDRVFAKDTSAPCSVQPAVGFGSRWPDG